MRVTRDGLADVVGVTGKTITRWLDEGLPRRVSGAPGHPDEYDTGEVIRWMIARETGAKDEDGNVINFDAERARLTKEQADKTAMQNEVMRGNLLDGRAVAEHWGTVIVNAKTRLLSIPTKAAPMLLGAKTMPQAREIVERFIIEVLNDLASADCHPGASGIAGVDAATEVDGEPVGGQASSPKPRVKRRAGPVDN
jgi:phage terminase Nu1 subunit (DNA packaging protein)